MPDFHELTELNGFDFTDLNNARQNNYAWSMSDLEDYIYVGTGRNVPLNVAMSMGQSGQFPSLIRPDPVDNLAEIWRYRKDGKLPWERVFKAPEGSGIFGFRFMIRHRPIGGSMSLYAASFREKAVIPVFLLMQQIALPAF